MGKQEVLITFYSSLLASLAFIKLLASLNWEAKVMMQRELEV